jgi:hypothetical protein
MLEIQLFLRLSVASLIVLDLALPLAILSQLELEESLILLSSHTQAQLIL